MSNTNATEANVIPAIIYKFKGQAPSRNISAALVLCAVFLSFRESPRNLYLSKNKSRWHIANGCLNCRET